MKMINKRKTRFAPPYLWLLLLLSLTAGGCVYDHYPDEEVAKAEKPVPVTIRLFTRFSREGTEAATRALSEADEGQVDNVYVFFLRVSDGKVHSVAEGKNVVNTSTAEKTFTANLEVTGSAGQEFRCIVLANAGSLLDGQNLNLYKEQTYEQIQGMLVNAPAYTSAPVLAAGGIVMWGEAESHVAATRHPQQVTVRMIRAVARVDVGVGVNPDNWNGKDAEGNNIPFQLKKVFIFKPNDRCAFMPEAKAYDIQAQRVTRPSPAGKPYTVAPFTYDVPVNANSLTATVYLPEANVRLPGEGVFVADPQSGDANHTKRCAIVVGGSYNGHADTYYRIDFHNGNGTAIADLLRNHRYRASITSVRADGESTPEEAYESRRVNISATILGWNDWSQDVSFDGVDYVYVEKKSILLPGNAGLVGAIGIESNVDPAEWQMSLDGVNYLTTAVISNADFEVAKPAVKKGSLLIRTRTQLADGMQPKTATLAVKIHRLSFTISIEQRPDTPEDWVDGGEFPKDF